LIDAPRHIQSSQEQATDAEVLLFVIRALTLNSTQSVIRSLGPLQAALRGCERALADLPDCLAREEAFESIASARELLDKVLFDIEDSRNRLAGGRSRACCTKTQGNA
jgi:hypothetical protein